MRRARLAALTLPDFGEATTEPPLETPIYRARIERLRKVMAQKELDAIVIYGDREHVANISWATGYDPRFEEALCIIPKNGMLSLLAGNEGLPYAETAAGEFNRVLWQPLSLMGQPRDRMRALPEILAEAGLKRGDRIGLAGWKGFETEDGVFDPNWFETPHYLVETLRSFGPVTNAALLFMHPTDGLRVINEVEQLARFEYAATLSSNAVKRFIAGARPGMTEYAACRNMALDSFPHSTHVNMCAGPLAKYGLPSPSMRWYLGARVSPVFAHFE